MATKQIQISQINLFEQFAQILQKSPNIIFNSKLQNAIIKYLKDPVDENLLKEIKDEELKSYVELQLNILSEMQKLSAIKICKQAFDSLKSMYNTAFSKQDTKFMQKLDEDSRDINNELKQLRIYLSRTRDPVKSVFDAYIKNYQENSVLNAKIALENENRDNKKRKKNKKKDEKAGAKGKSRILKKIIKSKKQKRSEEEELVKNKVKNRDYEALLQQQKELIGNLDAIMGRIAKMIDNIKNSFINASESLEKFNIHEMKSYDNYILYFLNKSKIDSLESTVAILNSLFDFTKLPEYAPDKLSGEKSNQKK